jgi:Spy/CpxP family protein refolding chaperone
MKISLFNVILTATILALPSFALAQDAKPEGKGRGRMNPEERVAQMKEKLSLTDEQAAKVKTVLESHQGRSASCAKTRRSLLKIAGRR